MTEKTPRFRGTYTALITPFTDELAVDERAFRILVKRQVEEGIEGVVPCGTTGESATLEPAEQERLIAAAVETAKAPSRATVLAGAGSNDTKKAITLAKAAARAGADGVLVVTPYYNKPTPAGLLAHYRAVADSSPVPVVLYNVPGRTGVNMLPDTVLALAEHGNIAGIKDASGNLDQVSEILRSRPARFAVLSGEDSLTLPLVALGGDGAIAVVSNEVPAPFGLMVRAALAGDLTTARRLHFDLLPLMKANFVESNPIPVKYAMERLQLCRAHVRPPLAPLSEPARPKVDAALRAMKLLRQAQP